MSPTQVRVRETCKKCNGDKLIQHPLWSEFQAELDNNPMSDDEIRSWWAGKGYLDMPQPEEFCPVCNGEGWTYKYIDVHDLAKLIDGN